MTKLERQIDLLKRKIHELTSENQILRDINVKLQIENYNLTKKLECKSTEELGIDAQMNNCQDDTDGLLKEGRSKNLTELKRTTTEPSALGFLVHLQILNLCQILYRLL